MATFSLFQGSSTVKINKNKSFWIQKTEKNNLKKDWEFNLFSCNNLKLEKYICFFDVVEKSNN